MKQKDLFVSTYLNSDGEIELNGSGKWSRFIGIIYLVSSLLILIIALLVLTNVDLIVSELMKLNGMSEEALQFMMGAGKWLFALMMFISAFILALNGIFLFRFGTHCKVFFLSKEEPVLMDTFAYLKKYFMLTAILSIVSTFFTIGFMLFYFLK